MRIKLIIFFFCTVSLMCQSPKKQYSFPVIGRWCNSYNDSLNLVVEFFRKKDTVFVAYGVTLMDGYLIYATPDDIDKNHPVNFSGFFIDSQFHDNKVKFEVRNEYVPEDNVFYSVDIEYDSLKKILYWKTSINDSIIKFPEFEELKLCK